MAQPKNTSLTITTLDVDGARSRSKSPSTPVPRTPRVAGRLDNKWRELEREWNLKNGEQLGRLDIDGKDGLLRQWKKRYDPGSPERSSQNMLAVLDKILNGVELVGAFAAQGVSMVFAPAGMCFNAIGFLLDIPKHIKEVYDALQDLFEEVSHFLVRFKIYKRLDDKIGLPDELVDSTTDLLITFIKICGVAGRLLRGGFRNRVRLGFKVLLRDDEMEGHLKAFRTLVDHSMMLNDTVMLEEVINNSEATKQILSVTSEMNTQVKLMVAWSNNEKTKQVNKDRLDRICRKLFERPPGDEMLLSLPQEDLLSDTLDTLHATKEHQQWLNTDPRSVLVMWGPSGCGKSRMLEAVRAHLEVQRDEAGKDQPNAYTAFFDFNDTRFKTTRGTKDKGAASFISSALRSIAYQVASQSTTYATDLVVRLSDSKAAKINKDDNIETVWSLLGLARLSTAATSTLYILLDGIEEQGAEGQRLLRTLLNPDDSLAPGLRFKILMTRTTEPQSEPDSLFALPLNTITKSLVAAFALEEMKRLAILQHKSKETRILRRDVLGKLSTLPEHFTFDTVKSRLAMLKKAIDDEAPKKKMDAILNTTVELDSAGEGQALLEALEGTLGQKQKSINLLNKLLVWLLYGTDGWWSVEELEAALYLDNADLPIEPLTVKVSRSYHQAINIVPSGPYFYLNPALREVLQDNTDAGAKNTSSTEQRSISLNISITNADESTIKQFVWDLNEHMSAGKFDFSKAVGQGALSRIGVDALEGHLAITRLCFKLINEGWNKQTEALLPYANASLPDHLAELQQNVSRIGESDKKMIGEGLVAFLRDPYEFEQAHQSHGIGTWMDDDNLVDSIRFWLTDEQTQAQLPLKERRWIDGVVSPAQGRLGYLRDLAIAIGKQWLTDAQSPSYSLYYWLDRFLEKNTVVPLETDAEAAANAQETQPSDTSGEAAATSEEPGVAGGEPSEAETVKTNGVEEAEAAAIGDVTEPQTDAESDAQTQPVETAAEVETISGPNDPERIERALNWVLEHAMISPNDAYNVALGDTYSGASLYTTGIDHHKLVPVKSDVRHYALLGLAVCYIGLDDRDNAYQCAKDCFELYRGLADKNRLDARDMSVYSQYLEYCGTQFQDWGNRERALEFLGQAYHLQPESHEVFWRLMRLHCEISETQDEALHLLQEWYARPSGTDPANSLLETAEKSEQQDQLLAMSRAIKNDKLRERCNTLIEEALKIADKNSEPAASVRLLYLQGVIHALNADSGSRSKALTCWNEVLRFPLLGDAGDDWSLSTIVFWATTNLVRSAFDGMRARLPAMETLSEEQKRGLQREMQDNFDHIVRECAVPLVARGVDSVEKYIISLNSLLGFAEEARQKCMDEMGFALEILSDTDPDNDKDGLKTLARVLCACGDVNGAFSAMSLLDREITRARFLSNPRPESPQHIWLVEDKLKTGWCHGCDGCGKDIFSADVEGMWWCRYCPNFDLCTQCRDKHEQGALRLELCSPSHVDSFMHMHHSGYTEEDIQDGKVKIDWEYVDDGNGGFTRKGGRLVNLEDWVEELRLKWNLPKPQGDGSRAQK